MNAEYQFPKDECFVLNLGPQHPSTHGVARIKLTLDGEYICKAEPVLGYIHRMHEKMAENRTWPQFFPNTGRLDYLHALAYNQNYACLVERALAIEVPERAEYIRVITTELKRIASHMVWDGALVLDLGGFTPLLYTFDDREQILDLLESVTGSRLTFSYFRFGGVPSDIDDDFVAGTKIFISRMRERVKMYHSLITKNVILINRLKDIGFIPAEMCRKYGATGPVARGAGIDYDVRRHEPYSVYDRFEFEIPVYHEADSMARYMVRMDEILQSLRIIEQAIATLPAGPIMADKVPKLIRPPKGDYYHAVETARGRLGMRAVSDGSAIPWRLKLRTPCFSNMLIFGEACRGMLLADAVALFGSLDLVIPDVDK
jgi:NADH-quinone oxidoreductase subunit D